MANVNVYYKIDGRSKKVYLELDNLTLELDRVEAEILFVDLGWILQDMDQIMDNVSE